jgi:hypothetical protein
MENIRVALRRAAADHSSSRFEELFGALYLLWVGRSRSSEGRSWAMELKGRPDLDPAIRIVTLGFAASVALNNSLVMGQELAHAAADLSAATNAAPPLIALSVVSLGNVMQGQTEEAIAECDRLIALAPTEPEPFVRGVALGNALAVYATCGVIDRVEDLRTDMAALAEELDNEYLRATLFSNIAPIIHLVDPEHAGVFLLRGYEQNEAIGNPWNRSVMAMFLALHELRSGDDVAAARWACRSLQTANDHSTTFVAQTTSVIVATVKRHSAPDAAVLLGALRAHRSRKQEAGTQAEINAEFRYETSLRRQVGAEFDLLYSKGQALDETAMIALAFSQLDAITDSSDERAGS